MLALAWVGDTLFLGYDLSAFDVITRLPHYKAEHEYRNVQQIIVPGGRKALAGGVLAREKGDPSIYLRDPEGNFIPALGGPFCTGDTGP